MTGMKGKDILHTTVQRLTRDKTTIIEIFPPTIQRQPQEHANQTGNPVIGRPLPT